MLQLWHGVSISLASIPNTHTYGYISYISSGYKIEKPHHTIVVAVIECLLGNVITKILSEQVRI